MPLPRIIKTNIYIYVNEIHNHFDHYLIFYTLFIIIINFSVVSKILTK